MKNLIYLTFLLYISFACNKKEDGNDMTEIDISSVKVDLQTPVVFAAKIMGKNLIIEEGKNGWEDIHRSTFPSFKIEFVEGKLLPQATEATISTIIAKLSANGVGIEERIFVTFPTMNIDEYNDISNVRQMASMGQKDFQEKALIESKGVSIGYNGYSTAFGRQTRQVEIVQVEEKKSLIDKDAIVFRLLLRIPNCKLFNGRGEYVGEIEDMRFATQFHYKPYAQPE